MLTVLSKINNNGINMEFNYRPTNCLLNMAAVAIHEKPNKSPN